MAFYRIRYDGKEFASVEMYQRVFKVATAGILARCGFTTILDTNVVGPLTGDEIPKLDLVPHTRYDVDSMLPEFVEPDKRGNYITIPIMSTQVDVYTMKDVKYIRYGSVLDSRKARLSPYMPLLRITGNKNMYVALDMIRKDIPDPVLLKLI